MSATATETINFTRGVPANESFPVAELAACTQRVLEQQAVSVLQYGPAAGLAALREWLAQWQQVPVERVLTGNGSLEIVEFLCIALLGRGELVFTESPSYDRAITLFRRNGAGIEGIPLQADGPDIDALEAALKRRVPTLLYVIPDFQNPSGATCSLAKRRRIVELAEQYNFLLLEDAPYRMLRYRGKDEPTLYSLAPHRVLHMSSFTKLIAPGVRTGFMLGDPALLAKIGKVAEDTYISPGYFAHGVTAEWCREGNLLPQIERLKALYAPRLDATLAALDKYIPDAVATRPDGGFFLSITLPEGISTTAVRTAAAKHNLNLADGLAFFPTGGGERFLRLPFCALTPAQLDEGVRRLSLAVREARA
ncbi:MAG TPA: PLP-dependent aminotransferase family protein [Steroidobacteraceae bacterium]|nr:PLP-dependent aminotransferase family protein [Steroidobacteraceae bacterium]